jgi:hypothetical protein
VNDAKDVTSPKSAAYWESFSKETLEKTECYRCKQKGHTYHSCATLCATCGKNKCKCFRIIAQVNFSSLRYSKDCRRTTIPSSRRVPKLAVLANPIIAIADTGANALFIHKEDLFDTGILPTAISSVVLADSKSLPITGTGSVGKFTGVYAPDFVQSLVPPTVLTDTSVVILKDKDMYLLSPSASSKVSTLITEDATIRTPFKVTRSNGLYGLTRSEFDRLIHISSEPSLLCANSTYFTTDLGRLGDLVRYFHESWNHASKDDMIAIVENRLFDNIPEKLTRLVIQKYFDDQCYGCKLATMREKTKPQYSFTNYKPGECCVVDIHEWEQPCFSGHTKSLHVRDLGSEASWVFLVRGTGDIDDHVRNIISMYRSAGYSMKILRADKQIHTAASIALCRLHGIDIQLPGPYEHAQAGDIESHIKIIVETVKKIIYAMTLSYEYWGFCVRHVVKVYNSMPSRCNPPKSRLSLWQGNDKSLDLHVIPALPFGSRVIAHVPLTNQRADSLRGVKTIYVGAADGVKGGILLFDPETKRTQIRVSFKTMGMQDELPSPLLRDVQVQIDSDCSYLYDDNTSDVSRLVSLPPVLQDEPGVDFFFLLFPPWLWIMWTLDTFFSEKEI